MKRFFLTLTAVVFILSLLPSALAQTHQFDAISAGVTLPEGVYEVVLTPENLKDNEAFIQSKGGNLVTWQTDFAARGILLQAYDTKNDRVLVISALADVDAQRLFDVNEQSSDARMRYRLSHGANGAYTVLGYRYDSVSWKNFGEAGRFLQLRYAYRLNGDVAHRGYQRRTIRNGYTITVDMQVFGRQLTGQDNTALNKVFNTFAFSKILPVPPLPLSLEETATAPVETNRPSFTMKGRTKPEAKLQAVLVSFATNATKVFDATANKSGDYSLKIELPAEDIYVMTLTVQSAGFDDISRSYNIRYQEGLLPVQMTSEPPPEFTGGEFILAGRTGESGVKAALSVNGVETEKNLPRDGSISFPIDTSREGAYEIRLVLSKRGFEDRVFSYTAHKALTPEAREEQLRAGALSPTYAELTGNPNTYDGKLLTYEGTLISKENLTDTWVLRLALRKTESGFGDILVLTSDTDPNLALDTQVLVYGVMAGMNIGVNGQGVEETLPKLNLSLIKAK